MTCPGGHALDPEAGTLDQTSGTIPALVYRCGPCDWERTDPALPSWLVQAQPGRGHRLPAGDRLDEPCRAP